MAVHAREEISRATLELRDWIDRGADQRLIAGQSDRRTDGVGRAVRRKEVRRFQPRSGSTTGALVDDNAAGIEAVLADHQRRALGRERVAETELSNG
jgi:hypothetical protein